MNLYQIFKHTLSLIGLLALFLAVYSFVTVDFETVNFIDELLFGTYASFLFLTILTYRLAMIHSDSLQKAPFAFFLITTCLLSIMHIAPKSISEIWQMTLAFFVIQVTQVIISKIELKGKFTPFVKASVIISATLMIVGIVFNLENRSFYNIVEVIAIATSLLCLIQVLLPQRLH